MKRTIKQDVLIRVALVFLAVIISGFVTITSMNASRSYTRDVDQAVEIHTLVLTAQKAHYGIFYLSCVKHWRMSYADRRSAAFDGVFQRCSICVESAPVPDSGV